MSAVYSKWRALSSLALTLLTTGAAAQAQLLPPLDLSARPLTLKLHPETPILSGAVYVTLNQGERARDVARAYNVPVSELNVDPNKAQPAGAVLRVPVKVRTEARRLPPGVITHRVRDGETLSRVASRYDLTTLELVSANLDQKSLDDLQPNDELFIPTLERGLLVRIKEGQDLLTLVNYYRADIREVARANALNSPTEVGTGDYLLLPGLRATSHMQELRARRERAEENERKRQRLEQYQRYLAYQKDLERRKLQAKYEAQAKYEKYLAWLNSPQRKALQAKYERQAQYEAYLEQQARATRAQARREAEEVRQTYQGKGGSLATPTGVIRRAAYTGPDVSWPIRHFRLTSRFGERDIEFHRQFFHGGIDLAAPYGTPIYAATDGIVSQSGYGDYGLNVWTRSGNATVIYGHMSRTAVANGQKVARGQLLGYVGCTGVCTGPHLHFEVRVDDTPVDPIGLLP